MIEDELRSVMAAHNEDAPTAAEFDPIVQRERHLSSVAAAVIVIALVVAGVVWARSSSRPPHRATAGSASPPAACPAPPRRADPLYWVPSASYAPTYALVPWQAPDTVTVCGYVDEWGTLKQLGATQLHGDLQSIAATLNSLPRTEPSVGSCLGVLRPTDRDRYLVRLTYGRSVVWVAVSGNHCAGASNGRFTTSTNVRAAVGQAYQNGVWPVDPSLQPLCRVAPDPHASAILAPNTTGVTICIEDSSTTVYRYTRRQLRDGHLLPVPAYNGYLIQGRVDSTCVAFDRARSHVVAVMRYSNRPDAVIMGTRNCMQGPGGVAMHGVRAQQVWSLFATAPSLLP